jgi:hypothetical protein
VLQDSNTLGLYKTAPSTNSEQVPNFPLTGSGNLHLFPVFGNRSPGDKNIVPAQHLTYLVIR